MKNGRFQAKDIDDLDFLIALREAQGKRYTTSRSEVEARLPTFPWKVVIAKARALIRSKLMDGCACGCSSAAARGRRGWGSGRDAGRPSPTGAVVTLTAEERRFGFHFGGKATE